MTIPHMHGRRVHLLTARRAGYVAVDKSTHEAATEPLPGCRRPNPSIASPITRGRNTLSVPAHDPGTTPAPRHPAAGVGANTVGRDHSALLTAAATNPVVTDRAMRVYTVVVALDEREVTVAQIAATLPTLTDQAAANLLGDLTSAGLLTKRLRTVGYKDGNRIRRSVYRLVGGEFE